MRKFILDLIELINRGELTARNIDRLTSGEEINLDPFQDLKKFIRIYQRAKGGHFESVATIFGGYFWPKIIPSDKSEEIYLSWREYYAIRKSIKNSQTKGDKNNFAEKMSLLLRKSDDAIIERGLK